MKRLRTLKSFQIYKISDVKVLFMPIDSRCGHGPLREEHLEYKHLIRIIFGPWNDCSRKAEEDVHISCISITCISHIWCV